MNDKKLTTINQLEKHIPFSGREKIEIANIIATHPMLVHPTYQKLIDWDNPDDVIRKMVIPSVEESNDEGNFDTSGESFNTKLRGLQHKYPQTALILCTNKCAAYCRFCFRKRLVGIDKNEIIEDWDAVVRYIDEHKEITNVLLSGGDPFTMPTEKISFILNKLSAVRHVKFLRIGTRIPVVAPGRIVDDAELLNILHTYSRKHKKIYIQTQFNHPREINVESVEAIDKLMDAHVLIHNQSVLLKGINDNPSVMTQLQAGLVEVGVMPYYIFQCRPVSTIKSHFQVPLSKACQILSKTKSMLDGVGKRFRFIMSHQTGKIEILGYADNYLHYKYHQTTGTRSLDTLFRKKICASDCWLML